MENITTLINQLFELQTKMSKTADIEQYERNWNRIYNTLDEAGYRITNPLGEKYQESRTDIEANIVGMPGSSMKITQVMKPTIYKVDQGNNIKLLQKALAIVE